MPMTKTPTKPALSGEQAHQIHGATGLSITQIRSLIQRNARPRNPITAAAWDEVLTELGLTKKAGAK